MHLPRRRAPARTVLVPLTTLADLVPLTTLADLVPGESALVSGFVPAQPPAVSRRLRDLGFRPGADVRLIRRAPLGDPFVYRVTGSEICLRRTEAGRVLVQTAP